MPRPRWIIGEDGPTHHGAFDLAYMRPIPNLIVASPYNEHELRCLMYTPSYPIKAFCHPLSTRKRVIGRLEMPNARD